MAELRAVVPTPFRKNTAFKAWWKASAASITLPAAEQMTWKAWALSVGVAFVVSSWEILFGTEESWREAPPAPTNDAPSAP